MTKPNCPQCQKSDRVEKVSTIYVQGIKPDAELPGDKAAQNALRTLSQRLAPPAGKGQGLTRPIHPDLMVGGFTAIVILIIYNMAASQLQMVLPAAVLAALALVIYALTRKKIIARFEKKQNNEGGSQKRAEAAVGRWMQLYYCGRDDLAFNPLTKASMPPEAVRSYCVDPPPGE